MCAWSLAVRGQRALRTVTVAGRVLWLAAYCGWPRTVAGRVLWLAAWTCLQRSAKRSHHAPRRGGPITGGRSPKRLKASSPAAAGAGLTRASAANKREAPHPHDLRSGGPGRTHARAVTAVRKGRRPPTHHGGIWRARARAVKSAQRRSLRSGGAHRGCRGGHVRWPPAARGASPAHCGEAGAIRALWASQMRVPCLAGQARVSRAGARVTPAEHEQRSSTTTRSPRARELPQWGRAEPGGHVRVQPIRIGVLPAPIAGRGGNDARSGCKARSVLCPLSRPHRP